MDEESGCANGTGKVDFDSPETAAKAIKELNGSKLEGSQLTIRPLADVPPHLWQRRDTQGCCVFIGHLEPSVTRLELQAFAEQVGILTAMRSTS